MCGCVTHVTRPMKTKTVLNERKLRSLEREYGTKILCGNLFGVVVVGTIHHQKRVEHPTHQTCKHTNQSTDKFSRTLELKFFSHNYPRNVKNQSTKFKSRHIARKPWRSTPHYQRRLQCTQLRRAAGTVLLSSFLRLRLFPFRVPQVIVHTENLCPL